MDGGVLPPERSVVDVAFELFDGVLLLFHDGFDDVADGNDPDDATFGNHRQVANATFGHQPHAVRQGLLRRHGDDGRAHDLPHRCFMGRAAHENDFPRVVSLRDDADQLSGTHHQKRTNMTIGHELNGFKNRIFRLDGMDLLTFSTQKVSYCSHVRPLVRPEQPGYSASAMSCSKPRSSGFVPEG